MSWEVWDSLSVTPNRIFLVKCLFEDRKNSTIFFVVVMTKKWQLLYNNTRDIYRLLDSESLRKRPFGFLGLPTWKFQSWTVQLYEHSPNHSVRTRSLRKQKPLKDEWDHKQITTIFCLCNGHSTETEQLRN